MGRNDPCPCGSGKKYKKCCLKRSGMKRDLERLGDIAEAMCFYGYLEDEDIEFIDSIKAHFPDEKVKSLCDALLSYPINSDGPTIEDYMATSAILMDYDRAGFYESFGVFNDFSEKTDVAGELYDRSIDLYNKHRDYYDKARVLMKKAMMHADLDHHEDAIDLLKESMEIGDSDEKAGSLANMGMVYSDMGDYKTALECYKKALRIFDRLGDAEQKRNVYRGLAEAYKMLGDGKSEAIYLKKLGIEEIEIDPEEERLILKINLLVKRGKIERAIETCAEDPDLLSDIAGSFALGDHIMAGKFLRRLVEKFPHHGKCHFNFGLYLRENGEIEEAEQEYRRCIEQNPTFHDAHLNLGNLLNIKGRNVEAEDILKKGLAIGEDPLLYNSLGNVYANTGRFDEAEKMYKKSMGMGYMFAKFGLESLEEKRAGRLSEQGRRIWVSTAPKSKEDPEKITRREFAQFMGFKNLREYEKEALKAQKEMRESFIEFFGTDELLCDNGEELADRLGEFYHWHSHGRRGEEGKTPAQRWEEGRGTPVPILNVKESFSEELLEAEDVTMIFDEVEGQCILVGYGMFSSVFSKPDLYLDEYPDVVEDFLEEDSISPLVFFRMAERFPENAQRILREVLGRPDFSLLKLEDLMWEFKPYAMKHRGEPTVQVFKE